jgi:RNA polymerase sigma-70 factor (sigma-E family)
MDAGIQGRVAELYAVHGARAVRLAHMLTGDAAGAEDIAHDAFVRLLGRWRSIKDPAAIGAYLTRTVVNLAKNHHRRAGRARAHAGEVSGSVPTVTWQPDFEGRDELHRSLVELPHRQRTALVLRYCEDLPEAEVAGLMGTSPKAVRSLVGRGLGTLRAAERGNDDD